jgi:hypothetical protein
LCPCVSSACRIIPRSLRGAKGREGKTPNGSDRLLFSLLFGAADYGKEALGTNRREHKSAQTAS